jgi:hypothetical protein
MVIRSVPSRPGAGFGEGGVLDEAAPGVFLAGRADAVTRDGRLAGLDDEELTGVLRAWRRLESWCTAGLLAAIAELARRRPAGPPGGPRPRRRGSSRPSWASSSATRWPRR